MRFLGVVYKWGARKITLGTKGSGFDSRLSAAKQKAAQVAEHLAAI
jgi:hypothetical protein